MMMVTFFLPMERSMFHVGKGVHGRAGACHGHRLPEHGEQHDEKDGGAAHGSESLTKHVATCGDSGFRVLVVQNFFTTPFALDRRRHVKKFATWHPSVRRGLLGQLLHLQTRSRHAIVGPPKGADALRANDSAYEFDLALEQARFACHLNGHPRISLRAGRPRAASAVAASTASGGVPTGIEKTMLKASRLGLSSSMYAPARTICDWPGSDRHKPRAAWWGSLPGRSW